MSNTTTIYWACDEIEWLRAKEPTLIYPKIIKKPSAEEVGLRLCPAFKDYTNNTFGIHSLYDYDLIIDPDATDDLFVKTTMYDQDFFNEHVIVRSSQDKCFTFRQRFIYFTEEDSLEASFGVHPFFENNDVAERCMIVPGTFDIGKWFRSIDFAFYLKDKYNEFIIKEDDIFQYAVFHTDKKIVFKQFYMNDFLKQQALAVLNSKRHRDNTFRKLSSYYSLSRDKDKIIKAIKNNLVK